MMPMTYDALKTSILRAAADFVSLTPLERFEIAPLSHP